MSDNYREMYVTEALEHVESMNQSILKLEKNPTDRKQIDLIFRSAHTIKGMAATMGYEQTKELCKNIEDVFETIRNKEKELSPDLASELFKCVDILTQMINDENKKIDLKYYLDILKNPGTIQNSAGTESVLFTQLPTIRVKMSDLDSLVNLVGELIIAKMKLEKSIKNNDFTKSQNSINEFSRLVSDLQYQSLKLRLVPIETIFQRVARVVRDTSNQLGKKVQLKMEGSEIELDRTVLDAITEPLLHILRNCVDHGIENPDDRKESNKSPEGLITLSAFHQGEQIAIKIQDDGRGIDLDKVKSKAIEKGIISQNEADSLSEDKIIDLLGIPGLSTASQITDISGRGVGMDVVINRLRDVGGNIQIKTKKGQGTTMLLSLPLSVSIIGGLLVKVCGEKYVLPLSSISTTIKVKREQIKSLHGVEVIEFHDKVVPLISIAKILEIDEQNYQHQNETTIVIVEKNGKPYGLVVDSFERKQEIVIKKFNNSSDSVDFFTNATILPDGNVALILEPSMII